MQYDNDNIYLQYLKRLEGPRLGSSYKGNSDIPNIGILHKSVMPCTVVIDKGRIHLANWA